MVSLNRIIDSVRDLPALPGAVLQVAAMISSGDAEPEELERIIRSDEALSTLILRAANSAFFGAGGRVLNLNESIVRLGYRRVLRIALDQKSSAIFEQSGAAFGLRRGELWRGAVGGAHAAELLAREHHYDHPDLAYLAALLRDIGKLAIDACFGSSYVDVLADFLDPHKSFVECEREAFGVDHASIGADLAQHWSLPQPLVNAIRYHHEPPAEPPAHDRLFDIVHAADVLCLWAGLAVGHDGLQYTLAPHVRDGLGLERQEAEADVASIWASVHELQTAMHQTLTQEHSA
jgi:HD-like signal output (HDOD) protein